MDKTLETYLADGVKDIVKSAVLATFRDPRESAFMARFAAASAKAEQRRAAQERQGLHVPPFLIASITSSCNLHCAGCYSRCNQATVDGVVPGQLTGDQWKDIFRQAEELGVSFILLAGGEPMLRRDVMEAAGQIQNILFPVFTNGTCLDAGYLDLLDQRRNLVPVLSIEGDRVKTDGRRGAGVYDKLISGMDALHDRGLIFGASVTVTTENLQEVLSEDFVRTLTDRGCRAVFYVEFVPVTPEAAELAPGDPEREILRQGMDRLRRDHSEALFIAFPGDEHESGGCLAAGRGFFHINARGGAEPCPFSPYSDRSLAEVSLREALDSPLFRTLREEGHLTEEHAGGCVLYEKRVLVEQLVRR